MWIIIYTYLFAINIVAFFLFAHDKHRAVFGKRRIPEAWLLGLSVAGGAYGGWMGMLLFRHKTLHPRFRWIVPLSFVIWMLLLTLLCINAYR